MDLFTLGAIGLILIGVGGIGVIVAREMMIGLKRRSRLLGEAAAGPAERGGSGLLPRPGPIRCMQTCQSCIQ